MPLGFVTKYRHKVFTSRYLARMEESVRAVSANLGAELRELNGDPDHVHLLVNFPPAMTISRLVNSLQGVSSRRPRQEFPELAHRHRPAKRLWSGSYSARSVGGAPLTALRQYIEQQSRPPQQAHPWPPSPPA